MVLFILYKQILKFTRCSKYINIFNGLKLDGECSFVSQISASGIVKLTMVTQKQIMKLIKTYKTTNSLSRFP